MKKLLAIAALLSAPAIAQANLVVNGSFEDYSTVAAGTWSTFGSGYGWTTGANGVEIRNAVVGTAADGVRFAELDTNVNSWISQTIQTNANQTLELSFSYAPRADVSAGSNPIQIFWNDQSLGTITGNGNKGSSWLDLIYDVQADANGFGVLKFAAIGVSDGLGGSLDNISVTAIPEPDTSAMLLAGLGILAAVTRRRQRRA
ncbi:MAG: PEP-CTERM sorting domain-containing protein [Azonexus sp.]